MPFENLPLRVVLLDEKHDRRAVVRVVMDLAIGAESVVAEASSLDQALRAVTSKSADAIVVEIQMAGGQGMEVISALRAAHPNLAIAVCTFANDAATRLQANVAGADIYLAKPVGVEEFRSIRTLVAAKEQPPRTDDPLPSLDLPEAARGDSQLQRI